MGPWPALTSQPAPSAACARCAPGPTRAPLTSTLSSTRARAPTTLPACSTDRLTRAPRRTRAPAPTTACGPTQASVSILAPAPTWTGARRPSSLGDDRRRRDLDAGGPQVFAARRRHAVEHVDVRVQVALRGADVAPVALVHGPEETPRRGEAGEDIALHAARPAPGNEVEHFAVQQVDPGVDQRRTGPPVRLLHELGDRPVGAEPNGPVTAGVLHARQADGGQRPVRLVSPCHRRQVGVAQHVPVEDEDGPSAEQGGTVRHGPRGAERGLLAHVFDAHAGAVAVPERGHDLVGQVAAREYGTLHAVPRQSVEDVRHEWALHQRCDRLRHVRADRAQPRALVSDEDHGLRAGRAQGPSRSVRAQARDVTPAAATERLRRAKSAIRQRSLQ